MARLKEKRRDNLQGLSAERAQLLRACVRKLQKA